jgi:hypothetical protein
MSVARRAPAYLTGLTVALLALTMVPASWAGPASGSAPHGPSLPSTSSPATYTVRFVASGLAQSYNWSVTFDGLTESTTTLTVLDFLNVANGTYHFQVACVGEAAAPSFGSLTVHGSDINQSVAFSPAPATTGGSPPVYSLTEVVGLIALVAGAVVGSVALLAVRARRRSERSLRPPAAGPPA